MVQSRKETAKYKILNASKKEIRTKALARRHPAVSNSDAKVFSRQVSTAEDFAGLMSRLMTSVLKGSIEPKVANSVCNAGGKLLQVVEMMFRYGRTQQKNKNFSLVQ